MQFPQFTHPDGRRAGILPVLDEGSIALIFRAPADGAGWPALVSSDVASLDACTLWLSDQGFVPA